MRSKALSAVAVCCLVMTSAPGAQDTAVSTAKVSGFDLSSLDRTVDPCVDFYQFACGTWMRNNPIPSDQSRWGRFNDLADRNREVLHQILERAASPSPSHDAITRKIGDYYAACMNEPAIDALGAKPLQPELARIGALSDKRELFPALARLHRLGVDAGFGFYPAADMHDSTRFVANIDQGGLALPDRDNYLKTDAKSVELRAKYKEHVRRMFALLGDSPAAAESAATAVLDLETALAKGFMDRTSRRDPKNRDHMMTRAALAQLVPTLELPIYFDAVGALPFDSLNVISPAFLKELEAQVRAVPIETWKTYLRWQTVHSFAPALSQPFALEHFDFFEKTLAGQKEPSARWKRCVGTPTRISAKPWDSRT
jgi:putative endopeptidase